MISVLVVGDEHETGGLAGRNPSVEVLTARGVDETLEKLGRNRRIDAVLLLPGSEIVEILRAVREDNPAHPPVFLAMGGPSVSGTQVLAATEPGRLIDLLLEYLEG